MGAGEQDRSLQHPHLAHLVGVGDLAEAVDALHPGGGLVAEWVAGVRPDGGDAGAHRADAGNERAIAVDERDVPHAHTGDIGDGVELAGGQLADGQAEVAIAGAGGHRQDPNI